MQLTDIKAVMSIDQLSFPTPAKEQLFRYELIENDLAHYDCLTAEDQLVGYIGYWLMGDEVHISTIATHPDWRGKGLGELLLLHLLTRAYSLPVTLVTLEVRQNNMVAQALYEKYQFKQVGKRRRYYRDTGEDAIIMTRLPLDAPYHNWLAVQQVKLFERLGEG